MSKRSAKITGFRWTDEEKALYRDAEMTLEVTETYRFGLKTETWSAKIRGHERTWYYRDSGHDIDDSFLQKVADARYRKEKWDSEDAKMNQKIKDRLSDDSAFRHSGIREDIIGFLHK